MFLIQLARNHFFLLIQLLIIISKNTKCSVNHQSKNTTKQREKKKNEARENKQNAMMHLKNTHSFH